MASGTGIWWGDAMSTGSSTAYVYLDITSASFDESTGVTTLTYNRGINVQSGNFQGSNARYGGWSGYDGSVRLYGPGWYAYTNGITATVAHDSSKSFYEWCGYTSSSMGYIDSEVSLTWYPTLPAYTVSYDANNGSSAPSPHSKVWGTAVTLSSAIPTRTGHSFREWNTKADGTGTAYASGASFSTNASTVLYAQWDVNTWPVSFDANGGTGAPASQTKVYGTDLVLTTAKPTRTNYNFLGWATSSSATSAQYAPGAKYTADAAATLYAVWELAYVPPTITGLSAVRTDASGAADDEGTRCKVSFSYATDTTLLAANYATVVVKVGSTSQTVVAESAKKAGANSYSGVHSATNLSADSTYEVSVTVTDKKGGSTTAKTILSQAFFTMDFLEGGHGVAIGKPAATADLLDVGMAAKFNSTVSVTGAITGSSTLTTTGDIASSAGLLKSTKNGNTVTIGSTNTSYCHFANSANRDFYFNKGVRVNGDIYKYSGQAWVRAQYVPTVLYDNATGSAGSLTLSQTAANFNHIRVYYRAGQDSGDIPVNSVDIYSPNGKNFSLWTVHTLDANGFTVRGSMKYISGTTLSTRGQGGTGWMTGGDHTWGGADGVNNIFVVRVEAWNE